MSTPRTKGAKPPVPAQLPNPLLDILDVTPHPKPFKNPKYHAPQRRNKNLKQILADTSSTTVAKDNGNDPARMAAAANASLAPTYQNIESAPSLRRGEKWCDITGLPARYTDPKTKLRYADKEVYAALKDLPAGGAEAYLAVRGANVVLK